MSWFSRLRNVFRKDELDRDIDEELRFHVERRAADLGIPASESRRRFGNMMRIREESRDARLAIWLDTFLQDIRVALRVWRKRPAAALAAIVTIALGAGMNIALFPVIWTVMLKPLPFPDSGRLVQVWIDDGKEERTPPFNSLIEKWREGSKALTQIASYRPWRVTVVSGGEPEQVLTGLVSPEFFGTLGVPLLLGRPFTTQEMRTGADNTIILREGFWRRRFSADRGILGHMIVVDGVSCTVTGIAPDSFPGTTLLQGARRGADAESAQKAEPDVYLPISRARVGMGLRVTASFVVARLQGDTTLEAAGRELTLIAGSEERRRIWVSRLHTEIGYKLRPALISLLTATGCVLLIACANLANLLMVQSVMRRRELAVRSALGAQRSRIARQLLIEAVVLLAAGIVAGAAAAQGISKVVTALYPLAIPRASEDGSQWMATIIAIFAILVTGALFGALPAWRATGEMSEEALRAGGNLWMSRGSRRWADGMVAIQVGLTALVLVVAGLLLKSFVRLSSVDAGIAREHVLTASVDLPVGRYKTSADRARFGTEWLERLRSIPGISAAGVSNSLPLRYTTLLDVVLQIPGQAEPQAVGGRAVGGQYFRAIGMSWIAGGPFDENRKDQIAVNEAFVRKYMQGRSPIGAALAAGKQLLTITGVVRDVRHLGLDRPPSPEVFMPYSVFPLNPVDTVIRSPLPPDRLTGAMRRELGALDHQLALSRIMSMDEVIDDQLAKPRFQAVLLGLFAAVAMLLAAVGTYGVIAQSMRSRVPEFGLRRALGAKTSDLIQLVLFDGMKAPIMGLAIGMLLSVCAGKYLNTLLYEVTPTDPAVLLASAGTLALSSLFACILPGISVSRIDPSQALRLD